MSGGYQKLGAKLRHNGIDAILDQWDLGPGDDITLFMESGLKNSDRVLVICTGTYVSKANAGEGGVGYERIIVTAELIQDLNTDKFIPVIRQASGEEKTPTFLATRMYIDLRGESQFETEFDKLLHELHQEPTMQKPPLGKSPFATLPPPAKRYYRLRGHRYSYLRFHNRLTLPLKPIQLHLRSRAWEMFLVGGNSLRESSRGYSVL